MKATAELKSGIWYLRTPNETFDVATEAIARQLADIINSAYEQGKIDKVLELREALYIYDEIYND